jgi:hypothetical protein
LIINNIWIKRNESRLVKEDRQISRWKGKAGKVGELLGIEEKEYWEIAWGIGNSYWEGDWF